MRVIVVESKGIVASAMRGEIRNMVTDCSWKLVLARSRAELTRALWTNDQYIVLCVSLVPGFETIEGITQEVSRVDPGARLLFYNGIQNGDEPLRNHIPKPPQGDTAGRWVVSKIIESLGVEAPTHQQFLF